MNIFVMLFVILPEVIMPTHSMMKVRKNSVFPTQNSYLLSKMILFTEITKTLSLYPWYHGNIRRSDSANLVLHKHVRHILAESGTTETRNPISSNTSGVFLVRLSGTR